MADLRSRLPAQSLMERTLELHPQGFFTPSGDALSWYKGALGEIAVAGVLSWLDSDWTILHSVPLGTTGTDIDHVVIGPPGAFTINTKSHPRQDLWVGGHGLLVDGHKTNYVNKAGHEAERTEELLSAAVGFTVPVTPLIVFVNPGRRVTRAAPERNVQVLADWELLDFLRWRTREFSQEQVQKMSYAAARPETWNASPTSVLTDHRVAIQFHAIVARSLQGAQQDPAKSAAPSGTASTSVTPQPVPQRRRQSPSRRTSSRRSKAVEGLLRVGLSLAALWAFVNLVIPALISSVTTR